MTTTPEPADVWVERTGTRTFTGYNHRGAQVTIGPAGTDGAFSPGELLKVALAACTGMSADFPIARRLGEDFRAVVRASGAKDAEDNRYPVVTEELVVDLSGLDPEQRERLLALVHRAVDRHCTVNRTISRGAQVDLTVVDGTP